jgi:hypothetical protein
MARAGVRKEAIYTHRLKQPSNSVKESPRKLDIFDRI